MDDYFESAVKVETHRCFDGRSAGKWLSVLRNAGQFMEPRMTVLCGVNRDAHFVSVVNDFGDLVCVERHG